ncbi:MAG: succinylglutamate desuccinylase/aspartoacylase family protein [Armatimonadetes bacterium]|nr:succinylglutamate desuccinylase/aspartoacylase family protein [Armatimonadota bacterium]
MPEPNGPLVFNGVQVQPSKTARIEIPFSTLSLGTQFSIPVTVVNGKYAGPKLVLSAALHGDELNGIEIVRRVLDDTDPRSLRGTVIAVPVVNVFGYLMQSRYLPDRRDLNRSFPGSKSGSLASQLANLFLTKIVGRADFGIDLHTGSGGRTNAPQIRCNLQDPKTRAAALEFGAPIIVQARERANSLRAVAASRGLPMLLFEGGEALRFDQAAIRVGSQGILRVMTYLGMKAGHNDPPPKKPFVAEGSSWLRTARGGVFHATAYPGDLVKKGETLGMTTDIYGRSRSKTVAPYDGMIIGMACNPLVSRGDGVLHIARREPREPREARTDVAEPGGASIRLRR